MLANLSDVVYWDEKDQPNSSDSNGTDSGNGLEGDNEVSR